MLIFFWCKMNNQITGLHASEVLGYTYDIDYNCH